MAATTSGYLEPQPFADGAKLARHIAHERIPIGRNRPMDRDLAADQAFIRSVISAAGVPSSAELAELRALVGIGRARTARAAA